MYLTPELRAQLLEPAPADGDPHCKLPAIEPVNTSTANAPALDYVPPAGTRFRNNWNGTAYDRLLARAANRAFRRVGPVLADRYHLHVLRTPREVSNALRDVLLNARHHPSRLTARVLSTQHRRRAGSTDGCGTWPPRESKNMAPLARLASVRTARLGERS